MILGISGFAQSGKDALAERLENYKRVAFADSLKAEVTKMLSRVGISVNVWGEDKEAWRDMLVFWGRKRRELDEDYWIKQAYLSMSSDLDKGERIVITDVRYPNEVKAIKRWGGEVIRLTRPGVKAANSEERETIKQIDLLFPDLPRIINDGSIQDMANVCRKMALAMEGIIS